MHLHCVTPMRIRHQRPRQDAEGRRMMTQNEKATKFRTLHQGPGVFVIANAWDAGSARILAGLGFAALATSSGASAGVYGRRDGRITRDQALAHARAIVEANDMPVFAALLQVL